MPAKRAGERRELDARLSGVLIALGMVYTAGQDTLAEEIVSTVGARDLLRVAIAEEDCYLPQLRYTIRNLRPATQRPAKGGARK